MIIRKITREVANRAPYEVWNAFVDLLSMENYSDLDKMQRPAHLVFWYDAEVQNGGHMQYFENWGTGLLLETLEALLMLGAECQHHVLELASQQFLSKERPDIETVDQYVSIALQGEFDVFDSTYHTCEPSIQKLLEDYLEMHKEHFIEIME
jgi:hypothetical protein